MHLADVSRVRKLRKVLRLRAGSRAGETIVAEGVGMKKEMAWKRRLARIERERGQVLIGGGEEEGGKWVLLPGGSLGEVGRSRLWIV
jgi:hypothetical protein